MAGETLSYTELKNWYTTFNNVISNYGGNLSTKSVPSSGSKAVASNINNLFTAINEMANEEYLGTQSSLYSTDYTVVASGGKITRSSTTPISNTASKITQIKCRNKISYSCGTNNNGTNSDSYNYNGTCSSGSCSNGSCSYSTRMCGSKSSGNWSNGNNSNGSCSSGTNNNAANSDTSNSSGNQSNGTKIDILNANTSY